MHAKRMNGGPDRYTPIRVMAKWGRVALLVAIVAALVFTLLASFIPSLQAYRYASTRVLTATIGICGVALGGEEWGRWYGKVTALAGCLILLAFFVPQLPGGLYIMTGCTVTILIFLIAGYGRKEREGEGKRRVE